MNEPMRAAKIITIAGAIAACVALLMHYRGERRGDSREVEKSKVRSTVTQSWAQSIAKLNVADANQTNGVAEKLHEPEFPELLLDSIAKAEDVTGPMSAESQAEILQATINRLQTNDVPNAVFFAAELQSKTPTQSGRELLVRLVQRWAEQDVHAAAAWIKDLPEPEAELFQRVGTIWARQDLASAIAWAEGLSAASQREDAFLAIAAESALSHPIETLKVAVRLPATPAREEVISHAAGAWSSVAADDAAAWAASIPQSNLRDQASAAVAISWADSKPRAAASWAIQQVTPGSLRDRTLLGILQRWASQDPETATSWLWEIPESPFRESAADTLASALQRAQAKN